MVDDQSAAAMDAHPLEGSDRRAAIALLCLACCNLAAATTLSVPSVRRWLRETGKLRPLIRVRRPEGTLTVIPPLFLLYVFTILSQLFYIVWTSCLLSKAPSVAFSVSKSLVWLAFAAVSWMLVESNARVTILAADLWPFNLRTFRGSAWRMAYPLVFLVLAIPLAVDADVPTHPRGLATASAGVQLFFFASILLAAFRGALDAHRAISTRCDNLLCGVDYRSATATIIAPSPCPQSPSGQSSLSPPLPPLPPSASSASLLPLIAPPRSGPQTDKSARFLRGAGVAHLTALAVTASPSPCSNARMTADLLNPMSSTDGRWKVEPGLQGRLKALKTVRRGQAVAAVKFCVGPAAAVCVLVAHICGASSYLAQDFVILASQSLILLWSLARHLRHTLPSLPLSLPARRPPASHPTAREASVVGLFEQAVVIRPALCRASSTVPPPGIVVVDKVPSGNDAAVVVRLVSDEKSFVIGDEGGFESGV